MSNQYPVILCHGLFGWGKKVLLKYWGTGTEVDASGLPVFEAQVGPVSSFHDRACELAAQIKGAQVDYGERHAMEYGHERYHTDNFAGKGLHPQWSEAHPVHLVGHSAGAHTILRLQHLLANDYWGWGSNEHWVKSISSVAGVLNGSTATYMFGCNQQTGLVEYGSLVDFLRMAIKPLAMLNVGLSECIYDWNLDHWGLRYELGESPQAVLARLSNSEFGNNKDNLAFDLTLQGCYEANQLIRTYAKTYYFAYVAEQTTKKLGLLGDKSHYPDVLMSPALMATATYIGRATEFSVAPIPGWGTGDLVIEKWVENDGLVPSISQKYPFTAGEPPFQENGIHTRARFEPGGWYWEKIQDQTNRSWDHIDIVLGVLAQPTLIGKQMEFYRSMYKRLAAL